MKVGSAVLGVHLAVLCAFALTQGCVTTESQGGGRGARVKGPFQHVYKKAEEPVATMQPSMDLNNQPGTAPVEGYTPVEITPVEPHPVTPKAATESYIVRKGDTLSQLAVDFDTTTAELIRMNNLANPDVLYVGQELTVPAGRGGTSKAASKKSSASIKKGGTYTIQKGDTLSEIALAAGVSIDELRKLNHIKGDMIRAGEKLDIPAGGKVPTTTHHKTTTKKSAPKKAATPKAATPAPAASDLALPEMAPATTETSTQSETKASSDDSTAKSGGDWVEERVMYPGETLDDVAREYGVGKAEIMRLNNITDESQVKAGMRLRIPIAQ